MPPYVPLPHSWTRKFQHAFRGIGRAVTGQRSFTVHLAAAVAVILQAVALGVDHWEWALLLLCIAIVLSAELFNTALEYLSRAITADHSSDIRDSLDVASGAVLVVSLAAAMVGFLIFGRRLWEILS